MERSSSQAFTFGPFCLIPAQQLLLEVDEPIRIGGRALDILNVLVERAGQLVGKEDLIARAWPDTFVEEGSLRVHIAALRRVLGDGQGNSRYIANVAGRGYRFVAPVTVIAEAPVVAEQPVHDVERHNLPAPLTRMVGRDDVFRALVQLVPVQRITTIVGPGGIGKTTLAVAVASELAARYRNGVCLVDLAPVTDPRLVTSALASVLGVAIRSENPLPQLVAFLSGRSMLLVLDCCEHVIDAAAELAEYVVRGAAGVSVLATSREPLRVQGERIVRLEPLDLPTTLDRISAAEALASPAVQLFLERAATGLNEFELNDVNASTVADICCRLDGIALAIELAASRMDTFSLDQIASLLGDRFRLLTGGRRTALPRHQTLHATLDWSHDTLPEPERVILRRLAVFPGWFTSESGAAVVDWDGTGKADFIYLCANLVAKSLVVADVDGPESRYRLLETTRAYALEKLAEAGEVETIAGRHCRYCRNLFEKARAEWDTRPTAEWLAAYGGQINDLRAALDWAFSASGDAEAGIALTVSAVPLWLELSLMEESRTRAERALASLEAHATQNPRAKMQLYIAIAWSQMYTVNSGRDTREAWMTALDLAEGLGDVDYQLRALWGLWAHSVNGGHFAEALALATRFRAVASATADQTDLPICERLTGVALHFLGDQAGARHHIEVMLGSYVAPAHRSHGVRFQFDQRVTAHITLSRVLWLQGFPDQASRTIDRNVEAAMASGQVLSLCNFLAQAACPVALWTGDLSTADRYTALLYERTARDALEIWQAYADCFKGEHLVKVGETDTGLSLLEAGIDKLRHAGFVQYLTSFLAALAEGFLTAGLAQAGRATIEQALARCKATGEHWCIAELHRIRGEIAMLEGGPGAVAAEEDFRLALDWSRRQDVLSYALRAATSFARLRHLQGRTRDARDVLEPVYSRFREGFGTADLQYAKTLLGELR